MGPDAIEITLRTTCIKGRTGDRIPQQHILDSSQLVGIGGADHHEQSFLLLPLLSLYPQRTSLFTSSSPALDIATSNLPLNLNIVEHASCIHSHFGLDGRDRFGSHHGLWRVGQRR